MLFYINKVVLVIRFEENSENKVFVKFKSESHGEGESDLFFDFF